MKILRIVILLFLLGSFLPLDGFCDDHDMQVDKGHHCVLVCHTCHHMVSPDRLAASPSPEQTTTVSFNYSFQYQSPVLDQISRPPKISL